MALEPLVLGRVVGAFGVRGWVKVYSYTDPREAVLNYKGLMLGRNGEWQSAEVVAGQRHGKSVIAQFEGVDVGLTDSVGSELTLTAITSVLTQPFTSVPVTV